MSNKLALDEVEPSCYVRNFPYYARDQLRGTVYFIACDNRYVKIGFSAEDVSRRLSELQVGCPFELKLIGSVPDVIEVCERWFHAVLRKERVRGEWFNLTGPIRLLIHSANEGAAPTEVADVLRLYERCKGERE